MNSSNNPISPEEKKALRKAKRKARRARKAERTLRGRPLKNFIWWLTGVLTSFVLLATGIFVGIKVIPLKTYIGDGSDYVNEEIASKSVLDAILSIGDYSIGDVPIITKTLKDLVDNAGLSSYVTVDFDKINQINLSTEEGDENLMTQIQSCITVTATIDSIGGTEMLGDFGKLSAFETVEKVVGQVDPTAEDFNAKLYYYMTEDGSLARAFNNDKILVADAEGKDLYLPALSYVPFVDLIDIVSDRMGGITVKSMIECFSEVASNNIIVKILGDKTIKDIGSFSAEEILLKDVLTESTQNQIIFDILCSAVTVSGEEEKPDKDTVNLGHLEKVDINNVPLTTVLPNNTAETAKLYDVLCSALSTATKTYTDADVKVGDLKVLNTDNITLNSVMPYNETTNGQLYKILADVTGKANTEIQVKDLLTFKVDTIKISSVMKKEDNPKLYDLLEDIYGSTHPNVGDVTLLEFKTFSTDNIKLGTVLERATNVDLYKILDDAITLKAGETSAEDVTIKGLGERFNQNNVKLSTVITENATNAKLFNILADVTGQPKNDITIGALSAFNVDNIKLTSVMDSSTNPILQTLLNMSKENEEDDDPNTKPITLGNLGAQIDGLSIHDVYGTHCFDLISGSYSGNKYRREVDPSTGDETYILDEVNGTYKISDNAGIWIIMSFNTVTDASTGKATKYVECPLTLKQMQDDGTLVTHKIRDATIQQLIDARVIDGSAITNPLLKAATLDQVVKAANASFSGS